MFRSLFGSVRRLFVKSWSFFGKLARAFCDALKRLKIVKIQRKGSTLISSGIYKLALNLEKWSFFGRYSLAGELRNQLFT